MGVSCSAPAAAGLLRRMEVMKHNKIRTFKTLVLLTTNMQQQQQRYDINFFAYLFLTPKFASVHLGEFCLCPTHNEFLAKNHGKFKCMTVNICNKIF